MKFQIEIEDRTLDGKLIDLDEVRDAVDLGLDSSGMVLRDITYTDSYEED